MRGWNLGSSPSPPKSHNAVPQRGPTSSTGSHLVSRVFHDRQLWFQCFNKSAECGKVPQRGPTSTTVSHKYHCVPQVPQGPTWSLECPTIDNRRMATARAAALRKLTAVSEFRRRRRGCIPSVRQMRTMRRPSCAGARRRHSHRRRPPPARGFK